MKRTFLCILTVIMVILCLTMLLSFAGCGKKAEDTPAVPTGTDLPLNLASWEMIPTTWSSPNGATVTLSAVPTRYADGDSARFVVRLEGEEVASVPCSFENGRYTASADLNAEDGYCYYVVLTSGSGESLEVAVNTPAEPTNDALINMATALNAYCNVMVDNSSFSNGTLSITEGSAQIQLPRITNPDETITCKDAVLSIQYNGEIIDKQTLKLGEPDDDRCYTLDLSGLNFSIHVTEDDQQIALVLDVTLSNGQTLSANGGTWYCTGGELLLGVG